MKTNDYLRQIDLNPTINGIAAPIMMPLDPRGLCMFGFDATQQTLTNLSPLYTVFVSFDYAYDQGIMGAPMSPWPTVHQILAPNQSVPLSDHTRGHAIVWLDNSGGLPPMGTAVNVRISARA